MEGREEFYLLFNEYKSKVMSLAMNLLGNREDAEDVCQDAFLRVYKNLNKFNSNRTFKDWLYTILYNCCRDQLRKRSRFFRFFNRFKIDAYQMPREKNKSPSLNRVIDENILKGLKPKERITLYLWAAEGYTSEEISGVLKCSPSTARVHLYKARKKIKAQLEKRNALLQTN